MITEYLKRLTKVLVKDNVTGFYVTNVKKQENLEL